MCVHVHVCMHVRVHVCVRQRQAEACSPWSGACLLPSLRGDGAPGLGAAVAEAQAQRERASAPCKPLS